MQHGFKGAIEIIVIHENGDSGLVQKILRCGGFADLWVLSDLGSTKCDLQIAQLAWLGCVLLLSDNPRILRWPD